MPERAIGGFVLCPPIGIEASPGYRGLTVLAEKLEAAGVVVLRFDYTGTGDSAGNTSEVPSVETWEDDIQTAIGLVRDTGASNVGLVGLRVGALLAGYVAPKMPIDALALWDPCVSGQRYLREQEILGSLVSKEAEVTVEREPQEVDIPSIRLPRNLANSLAAMDLGKEVTQLPTEVLILTRPDRPVGVAMRERLSKVHTEWGEAPEQYTFFESHTPFMPQRTIEHIADWCKRVIATTTTGREFIPRPPSNTWSQMVIPGEDGITSITERPVSIEPDGIFGILSESLAAEERPRSRTEPLTILLFNLGGDRRTGPSRLWVDLGRNWATKGIRVLRMDLNGLGDSDPLPGADRYSIYPPCGIENVISATQFLCPDDPSSVLMIGACSGAYHAAEAAMILKSKAVWLLNPAVPIASSFHLANDGPIDRSRRRFVRRADPISRRFSKMAGPVNVAHKLMPNAAWWLLDRLRLYTYAVRAFDLLLAQGTETFLMCGKLEAVPYMDRGNRALRDRLNSGRLHFEVVDALDHGLTMSASRRVVARRLNDYVSMMLEQNENTTFR